MNDFIERMRWRRAPADRVTLLLRRPETMLNYGEKDWDLAIRQARRAGLLPRLQTLLADSDFLDRVPPAPRAHLDAARVLARKHNEDVIREVRYIAEALAPLGLPVILLKGAAYVMARMPAAHGRLFGDIDILLPKDNLAEAEAALSRAGWGAAKTDAYDQRYYRDWMHEIPPLQHGQRQTAVDVHHTIVPPTAGLAVDARRLCAAALPAGEHKPGEAPLLALAPADMVLHSAVHLFNEGEFGHGLRDLDDLNRLLRHFAGADPAFWDGLLARAQDFGLTRPLYYALRFCAAALGTPVPRVLLGDRRLLPPAFWRRRLMDTLFQRALRPPHPSCRDALTRGALFVLYLRSHYLRMPLRLLAPHLLHKAVVRRLHPAAA